MCAVAMMIRERAPGGQARSDRKPGNGPTALVTLPGHLGRDEERKRLAGKRRVAHRSWVA